MARLEQLNGIDKALNQGWKVEGHCSDHRYFPGLYKVVLSRDDLDKDDWTIGIGISVEQAIAEAAQAFGCAGYRTPQLEYSSQGMSSDSRFSGDLDCWLGRNGSFEAAKQGVVVVSIFDSGHEYEYSEQGRCFLEALNRAFPGEVRNLQKYLERPPAKRAVVPFSVPYMASPNTIIPDWVLGKGGGCMPFKYGF